ncbi:exonuclease domain-containing protein [Photobacterium kishitanii]|uniref:Exonuclease domain-containing protein n=1 Tax=Photobacterium kishitanii TaxID=318456 RepID=A0A2T3KLS5_9GAMM|nr:exonuclease domain-containing protein [Photobacterium kishitanii]PSV00597.1 hypothetical protein C9J27_05530 [Photobacterium kishitanii]
MAYSKDYDTNEIVMLDVEASSLNPKISFPIEIAWVSLAGEEDCFLINPESVANWDDWDELSQKVHKIKRSELCKNGISATEAVNRLSSQLNGCIVLSDCADNDTSWVDKLFKSVGASRNFSIIDIYDFAINNGMNSRKAGSFFFEKKSENIEHRALPDCKQNIDICKRIGILDESLFKQNEE